MALPTGDCSSFGVAAAGACAQRLEAALGRGLSELSKHERVIKSYAEELSAYCDPERNPSAFRNCQAAAACGAQPLVLLAEAGPSASTRLAALEALSRLCFGSMEAAGLVTECGHFEQAIHGALRPIKEVSQQHEHLAALQLLQALAAVAPEAPVHAKLVPRVLSEVVGEDSGGFEPCRAVRVVALEVLVSLSQSRSRRKQVALGLAEPQLDVLLKTAVDGRGDREHLFATGLLVANLCELEVLPAPATTDSAEQPSTETEAAEPPPEEGESKRTFGDAARDFWEHGGFFGDLAACLSAALRAEPWPPQGRGFHAPWKLAGTCMRMALAGYTAELQVCIEPLVATIEARGAASLPPAEAARAARLAAVTLRALLDGPKSGLGEAGSMGGSSSSFREVLEVMANEEPAACDLLEALTSTPGLAGSRGCCPALGGADCASAEPRAVVA